MIISHSQLGEICHVWHMFVEVCPRLTSGLEPALQYSTEAFCEESPCSQNGTTGMNVTYKMKQNMDGQ